VQPFFGLLVGEKAKYFLSEHCNADVSAKNFNLAIFISGFLTKPAEYVRIKHHFLIPK